VRLTGAGRDRLSALMAGDAGVWSIAKVREERIELALTARLLFQRGDQYVVRDAKVQIVDEFTGRILPDRTWERGLHQMIELMEDCAPTLPRETIARQTYPRFFARYLRIAGMTGTGAEVAGELSAQYGLRVVRVATNRPCIRQFLGCQTFLSAQTRWEHVAARATHFAALGRAVLIGTRSVAASEIVSAELAKSGADFVMLNALQDEREAEVVADAGQPGRITVATNMAGRGTDIALHPEVKAAGGLHVILTEFHESARVDRQLFGRAARQGDPGSYEACVSLDDELFITHGRFEVAVLRRLFGGAQALGPRMTTLLRWRAQVRAERRNAAIRRSAIDNDCRSSDKLAFAGAME
jgi:preprotein translocase subunit SecA